MTTSTREDVHRPSVLDPADYQAVGSFDLHETEGYVHVDPEHADKPYAETRHGSWRDDSYGRCQHCGHHLRYGEVFLHAPSGELLAVGMQCATKLDLPDRDAVKDREIGRRRVLARLRGRFVYGDPRARQACEAATEAAVATMEYDEHSDPVNSFLADIGRKFERDAYLSSRQIEAAWWAAERDRQFEIQRDLWDQEKAATEANAEPCPTGRIQITGIVLSTKWKDDPRFGSTLKMTVQDDRGFRVWGTVPESLHADVSQSGGPDVFNGVQRDDRVTFAATVKPSDDDKTFGFYKRPTKAEIIS